MCSPLRRPARTRATFAAALAAMSFAVFGDAAFAQSSAAPAGAWPTKPIRLVSPFNPGGAIDVLNRVIAEKLAQRLGQQVFVDAVPGANTIVGADVVAKAAARRLHLHDHDDVDAREQHGAVQEAAVRSGQGFHADHPGVARQRPADRAGDGGLRRPEGLRRLGQAAEPADHLRLVGHRLVGQRLRRDPGQGPWREPHPRALQGRAAGDHRRDRRQPRCHLRQPGGRQAAGPGRQAEADRHDRPGAVVGDARRGDLRRAGLQGLRAADLGRGLCAGRHAQADRRSPAEGDRGGDPPARRPAQADRAGADAARQHARGVRRRVRHGTRRSGSSTSRPRAPSRSERPEPGR